MRKALIFLATITAVLALPLAAQSTRPLDPAPQSASPAEAVQGTTPPPGQGARRAATANEIMMARWVPPHALDRGDIPGAGWWSSQCRRCAARLRVCNLAKRTRVDPRATLFRPARYPSCPWTRMRRSSRAGSTSMPTSIVSRLQDPGTCGQAVTLPHHDPRRRRRQVKDITRMKRAVP